MSQLSQSLTQYRQLPVSEQIAVYLCVGESQHPTTLVGVLSADLVQRASVTVPEVLRKLKEIASDSEAKRLIQVLELAAAEGKLTQPRDVIPDIEMAISRMTDRFAKADSHEMLEYIKTGEPSQCRRFRGLFELPLDEQMEKFQSLQVEKQLAIYLCAMRREPEEVQFAAALASLESNGTALTPMILQRMRIEDDAAKRDLIYLLQEVAASGALECRTDVLNEVKQLVEEMKTEYAKVQSEPWVGLLELFIKGPHESRCA